MKYTKKELKKLPLSILRGIDIRNQEEEQMVQEAVTEKMASLPPENPLMVPSTLTDNLTPEKEAELQARIDKKTEALRTKKVVAKKE